MNINMEQARWLAKQRKRSRRMYIILLANATGKRIPLLQQQ